MIDFFGYEKTVKSGDQIASSEFALITMGQRQSLVQSVQAQYGQEVKSVFEIGAPVVYWVRGHSSGSISMSRLVGVNGFFASLGDVAANCGAITPVDIQLSGGGNCYAQASGGLTFDGGVAQGVSMNIGAGQIEITESVQMMVANMKTSS
jgi:hypothetical protein